MSQKDISEAKNPDLRGSVAAMHRAAEAARQLAIQTGTELIVTIDGQLRRISGEELERLVIPPVGEVK
jgi:hypothetical protein